MSSDGFSVQSAAAAERGRLLSAGPAAILQPPAAAARRPEPAAVHAAPPTAATGRCDREPHWTQTPGGFILITIVEKTRGFLLKRIQISLDRVSDLCLSCRCVSCTRLKQKRVFRGGDVSVEASREFKASAGEAVSFSCIITKPRRLQQGRHL